VPALPLAVAGAGLTALLLLAGCNSGEMSDEDRLSIYSDSAVVHYEQGDLDRAQAQALRGLAIDRDHRPLNLMLGWILLRRDNRDDLLRAEQVFRRQMDEQADDKVRLGLAMALERLASLHSEAADKVRKGSIPTDAGSKDAGATRLEDGARERWQESLVLYEAILTTLPNHAKALSGAMRVSAKLGQNDASLAMCSRFVTSLERDRMFWAGRLQNQDLTPTDESTARKRVQGFDALLIDTHLFAASLLRGLGRAKEALPHLDRVVELDPSLNEAYSMRAQVLAGVGRLSEAVADIDVFIARSEKPYEHPDIRRAFDLRTEWASASQER
jgi:tetratricopeptide (TPR) repeat protein